MVQVALGEPGALSQVAEGDAPVNRRDGGLSVPGESPVAVVHDGRDVVGNPLRGHEGGVGDFEIALGSCN